MIVCIFVEWNHSTRIHTIVDERLGCAERKNQK